MIALDHQGMSHSIDLLSNYWNYCTDYSETPVNSFSMRYRCVFRAKLVLCIFYFVGVMIHLLITQHLTIFPQLEPYPVILD